MKKRSDKIPFWEALRLNKRTFGILKKRYPLMFVSSAAYAAVKALTPYVGIYLSALIIGELAGTRDPRILKKLVLITLISAAALALLNAGLLRWKNCWYSAPYFKMNRIYDEKLLSMDFQSVDDPHVHDLRSQIMQNDRFTGYGFLKFIQDFEFLLNALIGILGAVGLSVTLFTLKVPESAGQMIILNSPACTVLIIAVMLAVALLSPGLSNKADAYWIKVNEDGKLGNRVFSFFGFMAWKLSRASDIRMYRQDILCRHGFDSERSFTPDSKIAGYARGPMGAYQAFSAAVSNVFTGVVYVFVCLKSWAGAFGIGSVTQYIGAVTSLSGSLSLLVKALGDMRNNAAFLRTTFEFLDVPNDMYKGSLTVEKRSDRKYDIEFQNVGFRYPGSDAWALRGVSLKFRVGERLAVVGQNGSGKTTFIKLLCRLYDPTEGKILLNGIDISKYDYEEYMSIFSVVFQDFKLLAFSVGQNVAAKAEYDRERVTECLEKAGFGDRLQRMPDGTETCLYKDFDDKGVEISGGEAQKIALARALYKDAPFIVLDEPTAALDPVAEYEIYTKFNEIIGDKTAIFISHRLSSCRFCSDIAVFDHGKIVQRGSHDELVASDGKYRELWFAQAQYYVEDRAQAES